MHAPLLLVDNLRSVDHPDLLVQLRQLLLPLLLLQVRLVPLEALLVLLVAILFNILADDAVNLLIF